MRQRPASDSPVETGGLALAYPPNAVVVVAGLPGAGKTTLLRRVFTGQHPATAVVDSEHAHDRYRRLHHGGIGYRLVRPLVHAERQVRLIVAVLTHRSVVVHDPATSQRMRRWIAWLARRSGHSAHLLILDVDPETARGGQQRRGRVLNHRAMARHCRRWRALNLRIAAGAEPWRGEGYASCLRLSRPQADGVRSIAFNASGAKPRAQRSSSNQIDLPMAVG